MSVTQTFEREISARRKAEREQRAAQKMTVVRELPVRLEAAKADFLKDTEVARAPLSDLTKRLEGLVLPYKGLSHIRTRWGLRYSFSDARDAARDHFDRDHKVGYVMSAEREMQSIVMGRQAEAYAQHGIRTRMLNWNGFDENVIRPVVENGTFQGFTIKVNVDEVTKKYSVTSEFIQSAKGSKDKREILSADEVEEFVKDRLRSHIEMQRHIVRFGSKVGAIAGAVGLSGLIMANILHDDRPGTRAGEAPPVAMQPLSIP